MQVVCCLSLSASPQRSPQAAACVAAPRSHCEPWAVSECVLSLVGLVFQSAAMTLSRGKPHAFLPVGGFRHFLAGGLMECACMYACEGQRWSCLGQAQVGAPRLVVNNCLRQPPHAAAATLSPVCCATLVWWEGQYPFLLLSAHAWTQRYLGPNPLLVVLPWWLLASPSRSGEGDSGER